MNMLQLVLLCSLLGSLSDYGAFAEAVSNPPDSCAYFFDALHTVPHESVSRRHGKLTSTWDGKPFQRYKVTFVTQDALKDNGVDAQYLTLEVTESLLMKNAEEAVGILSQLRTLGLKISMDDFGTGYSSLSYLKRFPLHELKIDRSFLADIMSNPEDKALVSAMIYLAHEFGLKAVVECVEAQDQLDLLVTLNCDQYQGYFCSRPVPAETLTAMLSALCAGVKA